MKLIFGRKRRRKALEATLTEEKQVHLWRLYPLGKHYRKGRPSLRPSVFFLLSFLRKVLNEEFLHHEEPFDALFWSEGAEIFHILFRGTSYVDLEREVTLRRSPRCLCALISI